LSRIKLLLSNCRRRLWIRDEVDRVVREEREKRKWMKR
jgi:hypothetical protein